MAQNASSRHYTRPNGYKWQSFGLEGSCHAAVLFAQSEREGKNRLILVNDLQCVEHTSVEPEVSSESWSLPTLLGCATHQVLEVSHDSGQQLLFATWLLWVANLEQPAILAHGLDLPANDRGSCQ